MAIKERLTDKAGPLPVWGWALIVVAVGFVILRYSKSKSAASSPGNDSSVGVDGNGNPVDANGNPVDVIPASTAAEMQAEYTLSNQLGLATSGVANLATNVGKNTSATVANTGAETQNTAYTRQNTGYVRQNTGYTVQNTKAEIANTKATNANTKTIATRFKPVATRSRAKVPVKAKPRPKVDAK